MNNSVLSATAALELVINVSLSVWAIILFKDHPEWAIQGVAGATVIAYMIDKAILVVWTRKKLGVRPGQYTQIKLWILYSLIMVGLFGVWMPRRLAICVDTALEIRALPPASDKNDRNTTTSQKCWSRKVKRFGL